MENIQLSIIVPCFNCENTIREALESVFSQDIEVLFEVVLVNDGSTDSTDKVITEFEAEHREVKVLRHEKNRGGGAARNTGIRASRGKYIFCLDSDETLSQGMMKKFIDYLESNRCDGVAFEERRFYFQSYIKIVSTFRNEIVGVPLKLDDLFNGSRLQINNFLFSKEMWEKTGGYPEHHDFDTQGYEIRFISRGGILVICPDTVTYHRQGAKNLSYFERIYERGMLSINLFLMYEEIMYLFSDDVVDSILEFDIFSQSDIHGQTLNTCLEMLYRTYGKKFFISKYQQYLTPQGFRKIISIYDDQKKPIYFYKKAVLEYISGKYDLALQDYLRYLMTGKDSRTLYFCLMRCEIHLTQKYSPREAEHKVITLLSELAPIRRKSSVRDPLVLRAGRLLLRKTINRTASK